MLYAMFRALIRGACRRTPKPVSSHTLRFTPAGTSGAAGGAGGGRVFALNTSP